jgi:flagellin-like protein
MKFTKLLRSKKAISPIFATLILIAIAVIAGIVVYMFTSGAIGQFTDTGAPASERAAVQGVTIDATGNIIAYASSSSGTDITITGLIVKDMQGNVVYATDPTTFSSVTLPAAGDLTGVDGGAPTLGAGPYTVTLTSAKGGSFVSASFSP